MLFYFVVYTAIGFVLGMSHNNKSDFFTIACIAAVGSVLYTLATFPPEWAVLTIGEIGLGFVLSNMFSGKKEATVAYRAPVHTPRYTPTPTNTLRTPSPVRTAEIVKVVQGNLTSGLPAELNALVAQNKDMYNAAVSIIHGEGIEVNEYEVITCRTFVKHYNDALVILDNIELGAGYNKTSVKELNTSLIATRKAFNKIMSK